MSARDRILARVDAALERRPPFDHPGDLSRDARDLGGDRSALLARFTTALTRSGGEVPFVGSAVESRAWLASFAAGFSSVTVSPAVPSALRPLLPEVDFSVAQLGVSVAVAGAAATGSLVLDSREGRRLQLLPPVHLVWVDAGRVAPDLAGALDLVRASGVLPAVLALHSGPSKSADIGRIVVTGVHGPGRLVAAIVDELPGETSGANNT